MTSGLIWNRGAACPHCSVGRGETHADWCPFSRTAAPATSLIPDAKLDAAASEVFTARFTEWWESLDGEARERVMTGASEVKDAFKAGAHAALQMLLEKKP